MSEEPVLKKLKLENNEENMRHSVPEYISIQCSNKKLTAVLSDELNNLPPLVNMFAGLVRSSKDISQAIKILYEKAPLKEFIHLKRVRNNMILICQSKEIEDSIEKFIESKVPELSMTFESFKEVLVPLHGPKLKRQHAELNKIWSCNFHPDSYLEKLTSDNFFSVQHQTLHRLYMSLVFAVKHRKPNKNVCVIVDPIINSVVAVAIDNSIDHPIQHSAMVAIDNVAKTQNGGAWVCQEDKSSNCTLEGIDQELLQYLVVKFPLVKFGAKEFQQDDKSNTEGPYLCTNYYVYMLREPCLMCAMALIHARVKRVFYCYDNPMYGALKSKTKLHTVSSLNHHYEVFTGFL